MRRSIGWALCVVAAVPLMGGSSGAELRALVLSGANNHDWRATTPEIVQQLEATGLFDVDVTENPAMLSAAEIAQYNVLVSNYNGPEWNDVTRRAVLEYLNEGGGIVVIHAADNPFPGWREFESLIGVAWREGAGHGTYHRFMVTIDEPTHPVLEGIPHFLHAPDELYHNLTWAEGSEATTIASAFSRPEEAGTGKSEPMLLVNRWGAGRMLHTAMGHDPTSLQGFYHTLILQRGTEWAATGRVTQALPADLPEESWVDPTADPGVQVEQWMALGVPRGLSLRAVTGSTADERARGLVAILAYAEAPAAHAVARQKLIWLGADAIPAMLAAAGGDEDVALQTDLTIMANQSQAAVRALVERVPTARPHERHLALGALGDAREPGSVELFAGLLGDPASGRAALEALTGTPGREATEALMRATYDASDDRLPELLLALGERADARAAPVLIRFSRDAREAVQCAALEGLGGLATAASEVALRAALSQSSGQKVRLSAGSALLRIAEACAHTGDYDRALALVQLVLGQEASEGEQAAAMKVLGHIDDPRALDLARPYAAGSASDTAIAAVTAIGAQGTPEADRVLVGLLSSESAAVRARAAGQLAIRASDEGAAALGAIVRDPYREASERLAAAQCLGGMATAAAVAALSSALEVGPEAVYTGVVAALERAATLLAAGADSRAAPAAASRLLGQDETATVAAGLRILAALADPRDAEVIRAYLHAPHTDVVRAAIAAAVAVASAMGRAGDRPAATALLMDALDALPAEAAVLGVTAGLETLGAGRDVARRQGFLTDFHLIGPFANEGGAGFSATYPPEDMVDLAASVPYRGSELAWRPLEITAASGIVSLSSLISPNQNVVVYAYAEFRVDHEMDAALKMGSDDGIVAWLNGEKVHSANAARPVQVDQDVVGVHLKQGTNTLLLKITQGGGEFGFVVRIVDTDGRPALRP